MAAPISRLYNFVDDSQNLVPISSTEMDAELDQLVATVNKIGVAQASAPSSPVQGDIWCDTTNNLIKFYNGSAWIAMQIMAKGADVASATTTTLGTDGNYYDITGTTTITSIAAQAAGKIVYLQFDDVLTLTNGSNLKLKRNLVTATGATICLISDGTNWWEVARDFVPTAANALSGSVVQMVNYQTGASSTGTTIIPIDDTIPQNTEGDEYMTLAITPTSATNKLKIDVLINGLDGNDYAIVALFQDSTAGALSAMNCVEGGVNMIGQINLQHFMTAGTTSETTFKVRCGGAAGNPFRLNGTTYLGRYYGGVCISSITITEIKV